MNGAHDLGGIDGFGAIDRSQTVDFNAPWERDVFAITLGCGLLGEWNLDKSRFARENVDAVHYLTSSYYEHWLTGLETLLLERGLVTEQELNNPQLPLPAKPEQSRAVAAESIPGILAKGGPTEMENPIAARFAVGDWVEVKNEHPHGHTRAPRYVRGGRGRIIHAHPSHVFPDESAATGNKQPAYLYTVVFAAEELWGQQGAEANSEVLLDLFEPYLLSAS